MYVVTNVQLNVSFDTKLPKRIRENMRAIRISLSFTPTTFIEDIWPVSWHYRKSFYDTNRNQYTLNRHEHRKD